MSLQPPAVTSYLNALGLGKGYDHQALHWFQSSAFSVHPLCSAWGEWLNDPLDALELADWCTYRGASITLHCPAQKSSPQKNLSPACYRWQGTKRVQTKDC